MILDNVEGAREKAERGDLLRQHGHLGDLEPHRWRREQRRARHRRTNASRTMLMDLSTLSWTRASPATWASPCRCCRRSGRPRRCTATASRVSSTASWWQESSETSRRPFGQACLDVGTAKNTYGTGNFMLLNTGEEQVPSENGLLTTVCYKIEDNKPIYALEGSIAITEHWCSGFATTWA